MTEPASPAASALSRLGRLALVLALLLGVLGGGACMHNPQICRSPDWTANAWTLPAPAAPAQHRADLAWVRRFAPRLHQELLGDTSVNIPLAVDFDGDRRTANNRQAMAAPPSLQPVLYYALVATPTHLYLTYSLYHPVDRWQTGIRRLSNGWIGGSHENDGQSLQLVVARDPDAPDDPARARVIAAISQYHTSHEVAAIPAYDPRPRLGSYSFQPITQPPAAGSPPPPFQLESGKHAIRALAGKHFQVGARTLVLEPLPAADAPVPEPTVFLPPDPDAPLYYALHPIETVFWQPYLAGQDMGDGGIMDGAFHVDLRRGPEAPPFLYRYVPRFYDSDEWSIIGFKKDSGISPFYLGGGRFFFDPAYHWRALLAPDADPRTWSLTYTRNPYLASEHPGMSGPAPDPEVSGSRP